MEYLFRMNLLIIVQYMGVQIPPLKNSVRQMLYYKTISHQSSHNPVGGIPNIGIGQCNIFFYVYFRLSQINLGL